MGKELTNLFDQLFDVLPSTSHEETEEIENKIVIPTIQTLKEKLDRNTELSTEIKSEVGKVDSKIDNLVRDVLQLMMSTSSNTNSLQTISEILLQHTLLLEAIDLKFENMVPILHEDIKKWITLIERDQKTSNDKRATIVRKLDELLKVKSTGKIIASITLIPGFLKYEHHTEIQIDLNKWIGKIRSAF
jgi:hypothetical protein